MAHLQPRRARPVLRLRPARRQCDLCRRRRGRPLPQRRCRRHLEALPSARRPEDHHGGRPRVGVSAHYRPAQRRSRRHGDRSRRLARPLSRPGSHALGFLRRRRHLAECRRSARLRAPDLDRSAFAARRPDALRRRPGRALYTPPRPLANQPTSRARHFDLRRAAGVLCHHRRQDLCVPRWRRGLARLLPARIWGPGHRHRREPCASRDRLRLLQRTARARARHLGRGQDHRFRAPLGAGVQQRPRRLAFGPFRRRLGGQPHRPRCGAARRGDGLRHRFRPRPALYRWRQDVEFRLLQRDAGRQLDQQRDRRHDLLRRPLRPLRRAPHVHRLYRYRPMECGPS